MNYFIIGKENKKKGIKNMDRLDYQEVVTYKYTKCSISFMFRNSRSKRI